MKEDSLYAKKLNGKIVKVDKVDQNMIALIAYLIYSISYALNEEVGGLKYDIDSILEAAKLLIDKSSLNKEFGGILKR